LGYSLGDFLKLYILSSASRRTDLKDVIAGPGPCNIPVINGEQMTNQRFLKELRLWKIIVGGWGQFFNGLFTRTMFFKVSDVTAASKDRNNPIFCAVSHQTL
jgi:hypothetical protein